MNKKTLILILVILLIGGGTGYYFFSKKIQTASLTNTGGEFGFGNQTNSAGTPAQNTPTPVKVPDTSASIPPSNSNEESLQKLNPVSINGSDIIIAMTGGIVFNEGTSTIIRYMERGTGHIFQRSFSSSTSMGHAEEISNTTIPRVTETLWTPSGDSLLVRYTKDDSDEIDTFYGKLTVATSSESELGSVDGDFLDTNIQELTLGGKNKIFSMQNTGGQTVGVISNPDGKKQTGIFKSPLTEWISEWPKEGTIALTTKASFQAPGFLFFLNTANGNVKKILGNIDGLTTLTNGDTSYILYSESTSQGFRLNTFNVKTGESNLAAVQTLPEKCTWSKTDSATVWCLVPKFQTPGNYPDDWYQGETSFSDNIWKMNVKTGESELVVSIDNGVDIDGINLFTDKAENTLFFTNKKNMTLWSYDLR